MNSLASRFSTSGVEAEIRRAQALADEDEMTDAMWGSEAGLGTLASGHGFPLASVPDVREIIKENGAIYLTVHTAYCIFAPAHGRPRRPQLQDQDSARYHYTRFPFPGRCHRRRRLSCYCWQLHWSVNLAVRLVHIDLCHESIGNGEEGY